MASRYQSVPDKSVRKIKICITVSASNVVASPEDKVMAASIEGMEDEDIGSTHKIH